MQHRAPAPFQTSCGTSGVAQGRMQPPDAPQLRAARANSPRVPRFAQVVQRMNFDSLPAIWAQDKLNCSLCGKVMSSRHRHHCRVCGRSVCDDCASQSFWVRMPLTSTGQGTGYFGTDWSKELVCVDCVLKKKIDLAKARSPKFSELITIAKNPYVAWEADCWPHNTPGRITLNPKRGDVFATYVFELTN